MSRSLLFTLLLIVLFAAGVWKVIDAGMQLPIKPKVEKVQPILQDQNVSKVAVPLTGISQAQHP